MRELKNLVTVTGKLVKNNLKESVVTSGNESADAISGSLVLRTADNSEHEINFFSWRYKKDENKHFTSEESYFYKAYRDAMYNLKDIEHCAEGESPDVISITDGRFDANDFKAGDGSIVSTNRISARFINKVEPKDYENTVLEAKFEVEGVIEKISDELRNDIPTGNLIVNIDAIAQRSEGFGKDANHNADSLVPIRLVVDKTIAEGFRNAGYFEGCFAKLTGVLINTVEVEEIVEKAAFGPDIKKKIKTTIRKKEVKSGVAPSTIYENDLTDDIMAVLKSKRKAKLDEIKNGTSKASLSAEGFKKDTSTPAPQTNYNPFAQ